MWQSILRFFQSFGSSSPEASTTHHNVAQLAQWSSDNGFTHQNPSKVQLHQEYDHLLFFQQGSGHQTLARMSKQRPDDATVVADFQVTLEEHSTSVCCYLFENTAISLPKLHLVNRESALFDLLRGSSLSPISLPSILSSTHSALCDEPQWGDRVFKSPELKAILEGLDPESIVWFEADDCHALLVTTQYSENPISMGQHLFRHFAAFRYKKSGRG
jgi:hypothetical protein